MILAALVPLAVVSTAYACANLATLYLDKKVATPGTPVDGDGRNYSSRDDSSAVTIRLDSRAGRILWQGRPGPTGRITPRFLTPKTTAGYHVLLATQQRGQRTASAGHARARHDQDCPRSAPAGGGGPVGGSGKPEQPGGTGGASPAVGELPAPVMLGGFLLALALAGSGVLALAGARRGDGPAPTAPAGVSV